ncbi:SusC/RagA family TonB-linked outer membrane protein [Labilibaculum sp.]|uniref:SusC/RagA family TonB-linked outer membrane protein n=1 Tax=Labilibaculum sp. TaxID=2060723 RepID=UPI00356603DA
MKRKILMLMILLTGFSSYLFAQQTIEGNVVDKTDNSPLIGVSVYEKGTTNGTVTDFDGNYNLSVAGAESVLVFSFVGYTSIEQVVGSTTSFNVILEPDTESLEEVVVVGYGARKKSDVTGSVSSVKSSELTSFPVLDAAQAIQGRAAGVVIQSNNGGEPGAPIGITIRGNTSINASSSPLIVVDGFVGGNMPQAADIESMQILKDASATAIYGSQGANGVILVTTKKGVSGKITVDFSATYSVQKTANSLDLLNASEFSDYQNQIRTNQGNSTAYTQGAYDTDWQDLIYTTGSTQNYSVSISGGSDIIKAYASGSYYKQDGIVINSDYERVSYLTNVDAQVNDKLKVGLSLSGGKSEKNGIATQSDGSATVGSDDVISLAMRFAPDKGIYNEDGSYSTNDQIGDEVDNPYAVASERIDETEIENFRANAYLNYEILDGLSFKTTFGLSTENEFQGIYIPSTLTITSGGVDGRAIVSEDKEKSMLTESYLTYEKELGPGKLTVLAGFSYQKSTDKGIYSEGTGTISDSFSYYGLWTATSLINGGDGDIYVEETEIQSQYGRVNYDFSDKYLVTATVRRDGASNFAANEKYAIFPSAALGWKVTNENFMKDFEDVSNLKMRLSYGVTGNPSIDAYQSLASYSSVYASSNGETVNAVTPYQAANPDLKWESSYQTNLGVDLGLWDNKIKLTFDYYNIDTKDLIMVDNSIPDYFGYYNDETLTNVGEINNEGIEISLNTQNIVTDDFRWSTDLVFSKNKNTVVALVNGTDYFGSGAPSYFSVNNNYILREGEEVGLFWGYDYAGVYQGGDLPTGTALQTSSDVTGGEPLFYDLNGDGEIGSEDETIIGNPNPDFTWGLTNNFTYKNFDVSIFFQGSHGGDIFNMTNVQLYNGDANTTKDYYNNAWTSSNTNTDDPRVGNGSFREMSSRFVEDGSYVRLKNVSVGYTLPSSILEKFNLVNARVSLSAQNLITWTDYSGLDPEVNYYGASGDNDTSSNTVRGFDFGNYPTVKSVSFSLNLTF